MDQNQTDPKWEQPLTKIARLIANASKLLIKNILITVVVEIIINLLKTFLAL